MKKLSLLKTVLLLCALVAGSVNGWADDKYVEFTASGVQESDAITGTNWSNSYTTHRWTANTSDDSYTIYFGGEAGKQSSMIAIKNTHYFGNIDPSYDSEKSYSIPSGAVGAIPGYIKKIEVSCGGTTTRGIYIKVHTSQIIGNTSAEGIVTSEKLTGTDVSQTYSTANKYQYFSISGGNSSYSGINSVKVYYEEASSDPSSAATFASTTPSISFPATTTYQQVATTASGYTGTVTYEITANTAGATLEGSTVTVTQEGTVTVKATAPAITGFSASEATYTLTVTDTRDDNELAFEEDEQEVVVGEVLDAPTLTNPNSLNVTYESGDEDIATVDESGNVTGVAVGSTTITAFFGGNEYYKAGSAFYTIAVKKATPVGQLFYETLSGYTADGDNSSSMDTSSSYLDSSDWETLTKIYPGGKNNETGKGYNHLKFGSTSAVGQAVTKSIALTGCGRLTYKVMQFNGSNAGQLKVSVTGAIATGDVDVTGTDSWVEKTVNLTEANGSVVITFETTSDNKRIRVDDIELVQLANINLAEACTDGDNYYGTYSSSKAFKVPSDLIVSEIQVVDGKLSLSNYSTGDVVPANTGVMIASETKGLHTMELGKNGTSKLGDDNMLKASGDAGITAEGMTTACGSGNKFYRLTMADGKPGFWWKADGGASFDLAANKAYLAVPEAEAQAARGFSLFDEGETTGISATLMNNERMNNVVYNLNGQRVAQPTKGLYIVNGKKVVIK